MNMRSISLVDLAAQFDSLRSEIEPRVAEAMRRGDLIPGRAVGLAPGLDARIRGRPNNVLS